jgi:hypothetical protein
MQVSRRPFPHVIESASPPPSPNHCLFFFFPFLSPIIAPRQPEGVTSWTLLSLTQGLLGL